MVPAQTAEICWDYNASEPAGVVELDADADSIDSGISWLCVSFGALSFCLLLLLMGGVVVLFAPGVRYLQAVDALRLCQELQLDCTHAVQSLEVADYLAAAARDCRHQSAGFYLAIVAATISGLCGITLFMKARSLHTCAAAGFTLANMGQGLLVALETSCRLMGLAGEVSDPSTSLSLLKCPLGFAAFRGFDGFWIHWHAPEQTLPWTRGLWAFVVLLSLLWIQALASHGVHRMEQVSGMTCRVGFAGPLCLQLLLWLLIPVVGLAAPEDLRGPVLTAQLATFAAAFTLTVARILFGLLRAERKLRSFQEVASEHGGTAAALSALRKARRTLLVKMAGMSFSATMSFLVALLVILPNFSIFSSGRLEKDRVSLVHTANAAGCMDVLSNAFAAWVLANAHHSALGKRRWRPPRSPCRPGVAPERPLEPEWRAKVLDLSLRGLSLENLLLFYRRLGGDLMPHFQAPVHTTSDVVRHAIIPATKAKGCAYALAAGGPVKPRKMVTHNWQNLFRDLVAAVIADALQESSFGLIAGMLQEDVGVLEELVRRRGQLSTTYWICAFAVNQHAGICAGNPAGDVDSLTKLPYPLCDCRLQKVFNGTPPLDCYGRSVDCELNKFDDMMWLLAAEDHLFAQVIAVDMDFGLFHRAWCVAELAEARRLRLAQRVKMPSRSALARHQGGLRSLRVEDMKASRPEDVKEILAKIPDRSAFNQALHRLIFDRDGILAAYRELDAIHQLEEAGRLLLWGEADAGRGLVWRLWAGSARPKGGRESSPGFRI